MLLLAFILRVYKHDTRPVAKALLPAALISLSPHDDNNDNDNILFDHNVQIEITIFNSLENQIINWSGYYY